LNLAPAYLMNAQEAQTLQLHQMVVWTPDGMTGEVIEKDGPGVKVRWEDGQSGYYRYTDLLSQIERASSFPKNKKSRRGPGRRTGMGE